MKTTTLQPLYMWLLLLVVVRRRKRRSIKTRTAAVAVARTSLYFRLGKMNVQQHLEDSHLD